MIDFATFSNTIAVFVATYLVHSTLLLAACWLMLTVSRTKSHFLTERMWKLAAVLGIVTAFTQACVGPMPLLRSLLTVDEPGELAGGSTVSILPRKTDAAFPVQVVEGDARQTPYNGPASKEVVAAPPVSASTSSDSEFTLASETSLGGESVAFNFSGREVSAEAPVDSTAPSPHYVAVLEIEEQFAGIAVAAAPGGVDRVWLADLLHVCAVSLAGGFVAGCILLVVQSLRLRGRFGRARVLQRGPARAALDRFLRRHKIRGRIRLLSSSTHCEPIAYGLLQWTIVLPEGTEERLVRSELKALLAHEVAHLVRGDVRWLWAGRVLCTCFAFQPLNYLARRHWQQAAEYLCDDWALERGVGSLSLARCLTRVAEWRFGITTPEVGLAAGGPKATLVQRVKRLVDEDSARDDWQHPWRRKLLSVATALAVVVLVGFAPRVDLPLKPDSEQPAGGGFDFTESRLAESETRDWRTLEEELLQLEADLERLNQLSGGNQPAVVAGHFRHITKRAASLRARREHITSLLGRESER